MKKNRKQEESSFGYSPYSKSETIFREDAMQPITKLIIKDPFDKETVVNNPTFIPRIGDEIFLGYTPCSVVLRVIWKYDSGIVLIITK